MTRLVLHPTDTSQWYALVNEAQEKRAHWLSEDLESYLVFLLMRFAQQPKLASSVLAVDFLEGSQQAKVQRIDNLQTVGDKSLLFCGLFPGIAEERQVQLDYFVTIGRSAYASVADMEGEAMAQLFMSLCEDFVPLADTLQAMRVLSVEDASLNQVAALQLWQASDGEHALRIVCQNAGLKHTLDAHLKKRQH